MTSHSGQGFCQYFLVVSMIWFSYTDKSYINMLGITFSPQNYHHHQQILSKLRENNENGMSSVVWAVIVFGPRVWPLSARRHYVLRGSDLLHTIQHSTLLGLDVKRMDTFIEVLFFKIIFSFFGHKNGPNNVECFMYKVTK